MKWTTKDPHEGMMMGEARELAVIYARSQLALADACRACGRAYEEHMRALDNFKGLGGILEGSIARMEGDAMLYERSGRAMLLALGED